MSGLDPVTEVAASFGVDALIALDENGVRRVWVDPEQLRSIARTAPCGQARAHAIVDKILAACAQGVVSDD
ncbi:hypothetical protein [Streptomyces sp. NPDC088350]|uniref:hypothetical protein n=1 Tax=Streptomyces sp. NPDC088350 TaxID=3365854 RepID=UPI0038069833